MDMVGGIPAMSEAEFRQAKAKAAAEENAQQEAAATLLAAEASVAKQDRGNQVRARKGSALRKRAAAAAARVRSVRRRVTSHLPCTGSNLAQPVLRAVLNKFEGPTVVPLEVSLILCSGRKRGVCLFFA